MADQLQEIDRFEGSRHPRETPGLAGHDEAKEAILGGLRIGRLHHAWLIGGPEGIGKATFAYQTAKLLLGLPRGQGAAPPARFEVDEQAPASRLVSQLAHPDLLVLRRRLRDDGKAFTSTIPVEDVRKLADLFGSTAGAAGWRVCIIDSADDLAGAGANALLKMLEEPPARAVFLIVSHQPARLMATIRSRCRRLTLRPLAEPELIQAMRLAGADEPEAELRRAAALAEGSTRRALMRLDPEIVALIDGARALLDRLPELDAGAVMALADTLAGRKNDADFAIFIDTLERWMSERLHAGAGARPGRLAPLAEVWEKTSRAVRETEVLNMDRRPRILSIFRDLAESVTRMRMG